MSTSNLSSGSLAIKFSEWTNQNQLENYHGLPPDPRGEQLDKIVSQMVDDIYPIHLPIYQTFIWKFPEVCPTIYSSN